MKSKVLCIDPGEKRIGVAVSDPERSISFAHSVIPHNAESIIKIIELSNSLETGLLIIGQPLYTGAFSKSEEFAKKLAAEGLKVELFNEDFSTSEAIEKLTEMGLSEAEINQRKDAYAAQVILQRYLDSKN